MFREIGAYIQSQVGVQIENLMEQQAALRSDLDRVLGRSNRKPAAAGQEEPELHERREEPLFMPRDGDPRWNLAPRRVDSRGLEQYLKNQDLTIDQNTRLDDISGMVELYEKEGY